MGYRMQYGKIAMPFNTAYNDGQADYGYASKMIRRALKTHAEFGHVNHNDFDEQEEATALTMSSTSFYVDACPTEKEHEKWFNIACEQIKTICNRGYESLALAEGLVPLVEDMTYDLERKLGCPIDSVKARITEDINGFKIATTVKYNTF